MRRSFLLDKRGYIDPGTGGYLVSSMGSYIVGIFASIFAVIAGFFRHTLKRKWTGLHRVYKFLIIGGVVALLIVILGSLSHIGMSVNDLPDFDPDKVNVTFNSLKAYDGYTLIGRKLIDINGNIVHSFPYGYLGVIDDNGDIYSQREYEHNIWGRYSWNGSVIWEKDMPIHHEILLTPQDTLIVLTKEVHEYNGRNVEFDVIVELDKDGNEFKRWSTWDNLKLLQTYHRKLELDAPLNVDIGENTWKNTSVWGGNYDYYHTNSVSLIPNNSKQGLHDAFDPGNYWISMRHGSMVFIIDKDNGGVVWRAIHDQVEDNLEGPHSPKMLDDGKILIHDNGRYRGWTRLVVLDPFTLNVLWEYRDDDFFSYSQGYVQLLPNGNMLVTESEKGRVFEISSRKELVWEWWHPEMYDDPDLPSYGKRHDLYRATRYSREFIDPFLKNE